jgi:lysozyme
MITQLDQAGIDMMIEFEGCVLHPYYDQVHIPTIGIGCTYYENGTPVKIADPAITQERANELFQNVSKQFAHAVTYWTKPVLTQNQFNALFSFTYNIGLGGFKNSSVLRLVNEGNFGDDLKTAFLLWDKADGKVIDDLVNRRKKEYQIFVS